MNDVLLPGAALEVYQPGYIIPSSRHSRSVNDFALLVFRPIVHQHLCWETRRFVLQDETAIQVIRVLVKLRRGRENQELVQMRVAEERIGGGRVRRSADHLEGLWPAC